MLGFLTKTEKAQIFSIPQNVITNKGIIPIDRLKKGARIVGANNRINYVEKVEKSIQKGYFYVVNKRLVLYENESVMIGDTAQHAKLLKRNDELTERDGTKTKIATIKKIKGNYYFHRLEVSGDHTYFINDILVHNASRYWVGGTGNWDETGTTHWSATSGGSSGASNPSVSDNAFIDGNSGGGTVTLTFAKTVLSLDFTGFAGTFAGSSNLVIKGNLTFSSGMTQSWTGTLTTATNTVVITSNGKSFLNSMEIGIATSLGDSLITTGFINVTANFNDGGFNVTALYFTVGAAVTITFGAGIMTLTGDFVSSGSNATFRTSSTPTFTVNANHTIKFTSTTNNNLTMDIGYTNHSTFGNIWYARGASTGTINIYGYITCTDYKDTGTVAHNNFVEDGQTLVCTTFSVNGNAGQLIAFKSRQNSSNFTLSVASGVVSVNYLDIRRSTASGGASFYAGTTSTDSGLNSGWVFSAAPTNWTQTLSDTTSLTDSIKKAPNRTLSETVTDTDTLLKAPIRILSEITTLTDTLLKLANRTLSETVVLVSTSIQQAIKTLTETVVLTDTVTGLKIQYKELLETLSITDFITRIEERILTEVLTLTDTIEKISNRVFSEVVNLTDTFASIKTQFAILTETLSLTDFITRLEQRILSEVLTLTDTFNALRLKTLSETVVLTDTVLRLFNRILSEVVSLTDTMPRLLQRTLTEVITLTDTLIKLGQHVLSETVTLTDTVVKLGNRILTETITLTSYIIIRLNGLVTNLWSKVARSIDTWNKQDTE